MSTDEPEDIATREPAASTGTSPLRWLFVIIPVAVIVISTVLLGQRWGSIVPVIDAAITEAREALTKQEPIQQEPTQTEHPPVVLEPAPEAPATPEVAAPLDARVVLALIPVADPAEGARLFRMCDVCHGREPGAWGRVGPNLWRIAGARLRRRTTPIRRRSRRAAARGPTRSWPSTFTTRAASRRERAWHLPASSRI